MFREFVKHLGNDKKWGVLETDKIIMDIRWITHDLFQLGICSYIIFILSNSNTAYIY